MSIQHHPSDETLLRLAAGSLAAGPALVVSAHLEGCKTCRKVFAQFESIGGLVLQDVPSAPLAADALSRIMSRIQNDSFGSEAMPSAWRRPMLDGIVLPIALANCAIETWRWLGPGIYMSRVGIPEAPRAKLVLLKASAGRRMPVHGHSNFEISQVLHGRFYDGGVTYNVGDVAEGDGDEDHRPIVASESECITLAAIEGNLLLRGVLGRLIQPFLDL